MLDLIPCSNATWEPYEGIFTLLKQNQPGKGTHFTFGHQSIDWENFSMWIALKSAIFLITVGTNVSYE